MRKTPVQLGALAVFLAAAPAFALTNNLALTPPMGWNDWNAFHCGVNEMLVEQTSDAMATNGMKAAGYVYVNIDDGWAGSRDSNGVIQAYSASFPSGIKALADYVHARGLKLGVYTDHGTNTCSSCISTSVSPTGKQPGSFNYEYIDAMTYASWGVDYLKNDSCNQPIGDNPHDDYFRMADGLMKSGRAITYSLCANKEHYDYWSPDLGNLWRTTGDIGNTFASMVSKIDPNSKSAYVAGPGRWNDADMMEVGNNEFATNLVAAQAHFTMWCVIASPLIAGTDLRTPSGATLGVLTNAEAIAVDQDPAGEEGIRVGGTAGSLEVWSKPLGYDFTTRAVALFNRTASAASITCNWTDLALQAGPATVRDLWAHTDLGTFTGSFTTNVPAHGVVFLKIVGTPLPPPALGTNYLSDLQPIYAYTGFGTETKDKSISGNTLTLGGVTYAKGIGTHAIGGHEYNLGGVASRFQSDIGIDDEVGSNGSVIFQVFADGQKIYDSGIMTGSTPAKSIDLDVSGVQRLTIGVTDTGNDVVPGSGSRNSNDHSDWAGARVIVTNLTPVLPAAPTGVAAAPGSQVALAWNSARAAAAYNVKRAMANGGPYATIGVTGATVFLDTNVTLGTTYYYTVSTTNLFGESTNAPQIVVTPCAPPAVPANVIIATTNLQATVRWNAVSGATSYTLRRFTPNTPPIIVASGILTTNYVDVAVGAGSNYFYMVAAVNGCSQGAFSSFAAGTIPPTAPAGLVAVPGNAQVVLSWNATPFATKYNVKRATVSGGLYTVIGANVTATSYTDFGLVNGTTYYYVVSALDNGGEGTNSIQVSAIPALSGATYWTNTVTASPQDWNVNANWTNAAVYPNAIGVSAVVRAGLAAPQTIRLNTPITVGSLDMGDANGTSAYTLAANGGSLTFNAGPGLASILTEESAAKGDVLATPLIIATNLVLVNNSTSNLMIAGPISGAALVLAAGTLQIGDGATNGVLGSTWLTNNSSVIFNRSDAVTVPTLISGSGAVVQNGAGVLMLSGANSYSGLTTVQRGTLTAGNATALGGTAAGTVIANGAALDINGFNLTAEAVTVSGMGPANQGAILNIGGQQTSGLRNVALAGDAAFGGGTNIWNPSANFNRWDIRASSTSSTNGCSLTTAGQPYKLIKTGGNQVSMVAVSVDPALGDVDIQQGLMGWETVTSSMGNPASNLFVRAGATLSFFNAATPWNKHFVLFGDGATATVTNWSGANTIIGPVQLNGNCVFSGGGTSLTLGGVVSGSGALVKNGAYSLILSNANSYTGDTLVNAGTLNLSGIGAIGASGNIVIASAATLNATGRPDGALTLGPVQTLSGNGAITGDLFASPGSTLAPGTSIGALTVSGTATLRGTTRMELNRASATNDVLNAAMVSYGGTLSLTNLSGLLQPGDSFKLFNAVTNTGVFTNIVPAIPGLNLAWNTNGLTNGVLSVVLAVTAPPVLGLVMSGGNLVFSGSNGVAGGNYYLLTSTNIAIPLSNWTRLATNAFDATGHFIVTNGAGPGVQQFYLLQLP
jgi:alpha-galactosidase